MTRATAIRVLFALALVSFAIAIVLALTGGFSIRIAGIRISAHSALRPTLYALLAAAIAFRLLPPARQNVIAARGARVAARLLPWTAVAAASVLLAVAIAFGARTAGGSDSYGYLSQARLWLRGDLHVYQDLAARVPWPDADWTFSSLGYRPGGNHTIVPIYPPGLPLLMALFTEAGGSCGPFMVTPACAALLVLATYVLGVRVAGRATGAIAAGLVATSPTVLFMSLWPMSDVPAAALWTVSLVVASRQPSSVAALGAGVVTGIAIAVRPNLAPLAVFPAFLAWWGPAHSAYGRLRRLSAFALGSAPSVLLVAWFNHDLYGSVFHSGYGETSDLFKREYARTNAVQFLTWLWQTQGPLMFLFLLSPLLRAGPRADSRMLRRILLAFVAGVFACYLLYTPFAAWWFLRFLLPAFPPIFVLAADAVWHGASRFPTRQRIAIALAFALISGEYGVRQARQRSVFEVGDSERKYADVGHYIATELPPNAIVIASLHSGSVRYYSGRTTIWYEWLDPAWLDRALAYLKASGSEPYIVLEKSELQRFRERFENQQGVALIDRPPIAIHPRQVYLYAIDRPDVSAAPRTIPRTSGCE